MERRRRPRPSRCGCDVRAHREGARGVPSARGGFAVGRLAADPEPRDHRRQSRHRIACRRQHPRAGRVRRDRRRRLAERRAVGAVGPVLHRAEADDARAGRADRRRRVAARRRSRLVREGRDAQRDGDRHRRALPPARPGGPSVRLALGSVAPTVVRAPEAESFAAGAVAWDEPDRPLPDDAVAEFGRLAAAAAHPIDDIRSSAGYRRHAVEVLARRALLWTLDDWRAAA